MVFVPTQHHHRQPGAPSEWFQDEWFHDGKKRVAFPTRQRWDEVLYADGSCDQCSHGKYHTTLVGDVSLMDTSKMPVQNRLLMDMLPLCGCVCFAPLFSSRTAHQNIILILVILDRLEPAQCCRSDYCQYQGQLLFLAFHWDGSGTSKHSQESPMSMFS